MNKSYLFFAAIGILFIANSAFATVGGATYISSIAFSSQDNSVYYTVHDNGGRGCPPIIHKINISTLVNSEVKSCDQLEAEGYYSEEGMKKYAELMQDTYHSLPYLGSVSLKKNNIDVKVEFLSEQKEIEYDFVSWSEFRATLTQDGKEIRKIDFRGCVKDQPHVFEGYMIPNRDAVALLISNKGDCFEGGYVNETLHIIKGIKYYNKDIIRSFKTESATEPNSGNIVIYATTDAASEPLPESTPVLTGKIDNKLYAIPAIIILFVLGYLLGRKKKK